MQQILLQNATDYYKMRQVLYYKMRQIFTKRDSYYKIQRLLQIVTVQSQFCHFYGLSLFLLSLKVVFLFTFEIFASLVLMILLLILLSG